MNEYLINNNLAVGYCRLSKEDQCSNQSNSIKQQIKLIENYTKENNLQLIDIYIDDGYSGSNFNRPEFQLMMKNLTKKRFNCIITKDLSRLGRNYIEVGNYLDNEFLKHRIRYISINDYYDSAINDDESIVINNVCNDLYLKDIKKKIKASFDYRSKNKDLTCRKYGYKKDINGNQIIDEEAYKVLRLIMESFLEHKSIGKVRLLLKEKQIPTIEEYKKINRGVNITPTCNWPNQSIQTILTDYKYAGYAINLIQKSDRKGKQHFNKNPIIFKSNRPPIFTEEEMKQAKQILDNRPIPTCIIKNELKDHLKKKIYYKETNKLMSFSRSKPSKGKNTYRNRKENKSINADDLHHILYKECKLLIKAAIKSKDNLYKLLKDRVENKTQVAVLHRLKEEKRLLDKQFEIQFERKFNNEITETQYIEIINSLNKQNKLLEEQIKKESEPTYKIRELKKHIDNIYDKCMKAESIENKIEVIEMLIDKVLVTVKSKKDYEIEILYY